MRLHALCCRLPQSGRDLLDIAHWTGAPATLAGATTSGVYLVADDVADALRRLTIVNDRGRKHAARPLSKLLLKQPRVPMAVAEFSSHRQVRVAVRALLENAAQLGERKAYLLAVPRAVCDSIAARFAAPTRGDAPAVSGADVEWMDPEDVPPSLVEQLTGSSREMHHVRQQVVRAARESFPVLVQGETGTGKEVVARSIHLLNDARRHQPFVAVNCGAIPGELFESEVFGYEPGAFTSALRRGHQGLWRSARAGTLFLDEIGELSKDHQAKILRALQNRSIRPVGATKDVPVAARIVAATNRDLYAMTETKEFREDLYYRLAAMIILIPPLRDRSEDVAELAAIFWKEIAPKRPALPPEVLTELAQYHFRGNARELHYVLANLHTAFPKSAPTVERLRAVVRQRAPRASRDSDAGPDEAVERLESLRRLQRAQTVVGTAQRLVRRVARDGDGTADRRLPLLADVGVCLSELQLLCVRPDRFEQFETFEALHRLAGGVAALQAKLAYGDGSARRLASRDVTDMLQAAAAAVRRDQSRILKTL